MIRRVHTESGSVYEVDFRRMLVRREVAGTTDMCPTRPGSGEWRRYKDVGIPTVGESWAVIWPDSTPLLDGSPAEAIRMTITSRVVIVESVPEA